MLKIVAPDACSKLTLPFSPQIEKVAALEAAAVAAEEADQQTPKKEAGRTARATADGQAIQRDEGQEAESQLGQGSSNRGRKPGLPGIGLVDKIVGREPPPQEEVAPLVDEIGASEIAKSSAKGPKQSLASKFFGKSSANKSEANPSSPGRPISSDANGNGTAGSGNEPGFWSRAKGFIKKTIGKRGEDDSDSDEERRVRRRQPIDDSGWGSDEDDVSGEPGGQPASCGARAAGGARARARAAGALRAARAGGRLRGASWRPSRGD